MTNLSRDEVVLLNEILSTYQTDDPDDQETLDHLLEKVQNMYFNPKP